MATDLEPRSTSTRLEPAIQSLLARLRRRVRAYVWADGLAAAIVLVGSCFWLSLALDWLFEPPVPLRLFMLVAFAFSLTFVVGKHLVVRLLVPLADRNMALLVERRFRDFRDSLLTAVELAERPDHASEFNADMLAHTHHDAIARVGKVDVGAIFNAAPLVRRVGLAAALVVSVVVFAVGAREAFGVWARRAVLLSEELWPRKTHLRVEGLGDNRRVKIARGTDWPLVVKAEADPGRAVPEIVEVRYATEDGARARENMSREGVVAPGQAAFQDYSYTFKSVLAPLEFHVVGGDDREGPYHLDVVDSPTISRMTLHCEYPPYMHRAPREVPVAGLMQVPRGTQIVIDAVANKPLVRVRIDDMTSEETAVSHEVDVAGEHDRPGKGFRFSLPPLDADKTLLFTLHDHDGIQSREAVRLVLGVINDEPPKVNVTLRGIGTAITPQAKLPAAGEVADDYGVQKIWFQFHVDDAPATEKPLGAEVGGREKVAVEGVLEVGDLQLVPKQKFHWSVRAADTFALAGGPNVGAGPDYALDVVTPEQLRAMLEARELMLRRRFETIIEELTDTRNLLSGVPLGAEPAPAPDAKADAGEKKADPAAEPGDAESAAARRAVSPTIVVERVLQNCQRSAHETLQVAEAFDEIREEMINNRVDTEELNTRLKAGVADPLCKIATDRFPELEALLKKLTEELSQVEQAGKTRTAAVARTDAILVEMRGILDKMMELETFNEVLDLLRQIIAEQESVKNQTRDQQKDKLKDLTE